MNRNKIIRITTVPGSLRTLLRGQLKYMNQFYEVIGIASAGIELSEVQINEGIRTYSVNMLRSISPLYDLFSLWKLIRIFKKENPSVVHTHTPKAGTLGMLAAWICRIPVRLHTVAGLPLLEKSGVKRKLLDVVERLTYKCATRVYPNSFGLAKIILENGYTNSNKIKVIGNGSSNGIDTEYYSRNQIDFEEIKKLKEDNSIKAQDFVFIFIGRLVRDKGINELVAAFTILYKKNKNIKLLLVGRTEPDLDPLKYDIMNTIHTNSNILMIGYKKDIRPFLAVSHALVFPSYREGFPNVPLQACAMDLPCIVSDINGCNEIISHEYNGLLIPPKSTTDLLHSMDRLIHDRKLFNMLKSNARQSIINKYDQITHWQKIKEEYIAQLKL